MVDSSSTTVEGTPQTLTIRGEDCVVHSWKASAPKALAFIFHGFLAHSQYPTVVYAAQLLAQNNIAVYAADMPGHGLSGGLRSYLPSHETLIQDGVEVVKRIVSNQEEKELPLFLVGSSMGGTIALSVGLELEKVDGVVLLAPMLALNVSSVEHTALKALSYIVPTLQIIPSSSTSAEKQYRDPVKRKECEDDELSIPGNKLRVASACTCVDLAFGVREKFSAVSVPFLCMVANEDEVVDNDGSLELMDRAPSTDKTLKRYDALHGLLCEPRPLVDQIYKDLLDWVNARVK